MSDPVDPRGDAFDDALQQFIAGRMSPSEEAAFRAAHARSGGDAAALDAYRAAFRAIGSHESLDADRLWMDLRQRIAATDQNDPAATRIAQRRKPAVALALISGHHGVSRIAAAITIAVAVGGFWLLRLGGTRADAVMRTLATSRGESATHTFIDGTRIVLAPASTLRYPATFGTASRDVSVDGEAYFDVVHDEHRPLRVRTRDVITEDVGTTFVVRSYDNEKATQVIVASGRVSLLDSTKRRIGQELGRGDAAYVANGAMTVRVVDPARYVAWTQGQLSFDNTSVADVLIELSRWLDLDIAADSSFAARRVTAAFQLGSADAMLGGLASVLGARTIRHGRSVQLVPATERPARTTRSPT